MDEQLQLKPYNKAYLSTEEFSGYLHNLEIQHPWLFQMLDAGRLTQSYVDSFVSGLEALSWEFEDSEEGGRGQAYNQAQEASENRQVGMTSLLRLFKSPSRNSNHQKLKILDVLAGDGTIARFANEKFHAEFTIISADISKFMIDACISKNIPSIRQSATQSLFSNNTLDGGLIAYGSHHLDAPSRKQAVFELYRTIQPGGRIVLHDFEENSRFANWFTKVVHPYSRTGHPHPHFTREEMHTLLSEAGFSDIHVFDMDDRFTLRGNTENAARKNAIRHIENMYDLIKVPGVGFDRLRALEKIVTDHLGPIEIDVSNNQFTAVVHRTALVATGVKPIERFKG